MSARFVSACAMILSIGACASAPAPSTATAAASPALPATDPEAVKEEAVRLGPVFARLATVPFDVTKPLLWSYFFLDRQREPLLRLQQVLASQGFQLIELAPVEGDAKLRLHVDRVEVLSVEGLARRNLEFKALAAASGVEIYDGWEVGNTSAPK
jgi:hypothetical protein